MLLALLLQATPHVNPSATPTPDTILASTPNWMYSPLFIVPLLVVIAVGVYFIYKQANKKTGAGYINK